MKQVLQLLKDIIPDKGAPGAFHDPIQPNFNPIFVAQQPLTESAMRKCVDNTWLEFTEQMRYSRRYSRFISSRHVNLTFTYLKYFGISLP